MKNQTCHLSISAPQSTLDEIQERVQNKLRNAHSGPAYMFSTRSENDPKTEKPIVHIQVSGAIDPGCALRMISETL